MIIIAVWCCLYLFWLVNTENLSTIFGPLLSENCGDAKWGCDLYWRTGEYLFKEEIVEMLTQLLSPIFAFVALNFLANSPPIRSSGVFWFVFDVSLLPNALTI